LITLVDTMFPVKCKAFAGPWIKGATHVPLSTTKHVLTSSHFHDPS
jgi:hypothetical protein